MSLSTYDQFVVSALVKLGRTFIIFVIPLARIPNACYCEKSNVFDKSTSGFTTISKKSFINYYGVFCCCFSRVLLNQLSGFNRLSKPPIAFNTLDAPTARKNPANYCYSSDIPPATILKLFAVSLPLFYKSDYIFKVSINVVNPDFVISVNAFIISITTPAILLINVSMIGRIILN
jgi:hypothetical protein